MTFTGTLKKVKGKLVYTSKKGEQLFNQFRENLPEGATVDLYMEVLSDDGSLGQLAKVHKLIGILASHTGHHFEDVKLNVKNKAGLCLVREIEGKEYVECKSFARASFDDLSRAIAVCLEMGQDLGLNL